MSMDCEYSSYEYQVYLRSDLMVDSFKDGVMQVLDELSTIEQKKIFPFKVSRSSLNYLNVSLTYYVLDNNRDINDFYVKPVFKSRKKKPSKPTDLVMKLSDIDPLAVCIKLTVNIIIIQLYKAKCKYEN